MKFIILIGGSLAAGKSTFANYLTNKYNIVSINKDPIKEILGDNFGFHNREENLKLSKCSFDLMFHQSKKLMESNNTFIVESNFRQHELDKLEALAKEFDYQILSILIGGDMHVLHKRFNERLTNRHIVHKAQDFSKFEDFEEAMMNMNKVNYPGTVLRFDSTNFNNLYNENNFKLIESYIK